MVVFSSSSNPADIRQWVELGVKEFVQKPTDLQQYAERVCRIIRDWLPGVDTTSLSGAY